MNLGQYLFDNPEALRYFEFFRRMDYYERNKIEEGTGIMSLCAVVGGASGVAFASDTRSVIIGPNKIITNYDDQYQKIHKIQNDLYLMITGSTKYNGEPIIDIIKSYNPKTFYDLEKLIRDILYNKSSTLYIILKIKDKQLICESINIIVDNKKGNYLTIEQYPIFAKNKFILQNPILTFGSSFATNAFAGINDEHLNLYKKDVIIDTIKHIMKIGYDLSRLNNLDTINERLDIYYFDFESGNIEIIEKNSIPSSPHAIKTIGFEGMI